MAFAGCSNLTSVLIGDSVIQIGKGAFADCTSLTSVTIGKRLSIIGNGVFLDCSNLTGVDSKVMRPDLLVWLFSPVPTKQPSITCRGPKAGTPRLPVALHVSTASVRREANRPIVPHPDLSPRSRNRWTVLPGRCPDKYSKYCVGIFRRAQKPRQGVFNRADFCSDRNCCWSPRASSFGVLVRRRRRRMCFLGRCYSTP